MNLNHFFYPTSIAVVGASTKEGSVGNDVVKNIVRHGYQGAVYPVNPHAKTLFDIPCFASLRDIRNTIELVVIVVPAHSVPEVLKDAGEIGIRGAVIVSSGFRETGEQGIALEQEIVSLCRQYNIALLGPNCLGFINAEINLDASFAPLMPELGNISLVSQSGAICTAVLDAVREKHLGFSKFISVGNKAGLDEHDLLPYLAQDEGTQTIALYAEELTDANDLIRTGKALLARAQTKPVVALKAGLTASGAAASASHTGSLGGSEAAYRALFEQSRIIQAETFGEFLDLLFVFSRNAIPEGNAVAILTNAGGPGVLATDAAEKAGLSLAKFSPDTIAKLSNTLPKACGTHNPVDILGDARSERYRVALETIAAEHSVDMILVVLTPQSMTDIECIAETIIDVKKKTAKPIVASFIGSGLVRKGRALLHGAQVAVVNTPEEGAKALGKLAKVADWIKSPVSKIDSFTDIDKETVANILQKARTENRKDLSETEVWEILRAYGFPLPQSAIAHSSQEAQSRAASFGDKSIALKIVSQDIAHKSDAGGVLLHIPAKDAGEAYETLMKRVKSKVPNARLNGALLVEMAPSGGREIILGIKKEPGLGTMLMLGLGGIFVETFRDVAFRFAPAAKEDISDMLRELKAFPILKGARGQQGVHIDTLIDFTARLSQLATDFPEIAELDINPLLAFPEADRFLVLDGRIRLERP